MIKTVRHEVTRDEIMRIDMEVRSGAYRYEGQRAIDASIFSDATGLEMHVRLRGMPVAVGQPQPVDEVIYLAPPLAKNTQP